MINVVWSTTNDLKKILLWNAKTLSSEITASDSEINVDHEKIVSKINDVDDLFSVLKYIQWKYSGWKHNLKFDNADILFKYIDSDDDVKKDMENKIKQKISDLQIQNFLNTVKNENGVIDFDEMEKIGKWWTHNVFLSSKSKKFVLKLNRTAYNLAKDNNLNGKLSDTISWRAKQFISGKNSEYNGLYNSFWLWNCLYENMRIEKIKVNNQIIECPIVIQEWTDIFAKDTVDFWTGYIGNINDENIAKYEKINKSLFGSDESYSGEKELSDLTPKLSDLFKKLSEDKSFAEKSKDFLLKFKDYYQKEWKFIDFVWEKNILFYQEWKNRNFKLGSVTKDSSSDELTNALSILENSPEKIISDIQLKNTLMNSLTCARMVNSLGIKLGIGKVVDLKLNETQIKNLNKIQV